MGLIGLRSTMQGTPPMPTYVQCKREGSMTAAWMESCGLADRQQNPPNATRTLKHFLHLYNYATDMAYKSPAQRESLRAFRKSVYTILYTMVMATKVITDMQIVQLHPDTHWTKVRHNLHAA